MTRPERAPRAGRERVGRSGRTNFTDGPDYGVGAALAPDGKILAAGGAGGAGGRFAVARYLAA